MKDFLLFSGSSNRPLAQKVADGLGVPLGNVELERFADGELRPWVKDDVRGKTVFVLESLSHSMDEYVMETALMGDAIRRSAPQTMVAVIPYMGYARQDKQHRPGEPVSARVIAKFLEVSKYREIITIDLHNDAIVGFFQIPVMHESALNILVSEAKKLDLPNPVIVSPDVGGVKRARNFAYAFGADMVVMEKRRFMDRRDETEHYQIIGDVNGHDAVIIDDVISTGGTTANAAHTLIDAGASSVTVCASHAVLAGDALRILSEAPIRHLIVTDTIDHTGHPLPPCTSTVSVAPVIVEAIRKIAG